MLESDFLDMNQLNIQCDESISALSDSNARLNGISNVYKAANETDCTGETADSFYEYCDRIVTLISAIELANDKDILDNGTLKSFLREGLVLDGRVILPSKRRAAENERREREAADECESRSHGVSPEEKHYWRHEYRCHKQAADSYRREKEFWESRERKFDEINNATKNLFKESKSYRDGVIKEGIKSLSKDFNVTTGTFELDDSWKNGFEKLYNNVSIVDEFKNSWKDENGAYNLDVLNDIYNNRIDKLSANEAEAFAAVLKELHPDAQKQVLGHVAASDADIKGLVQGVVKSLGFGGKTGVGVYNIATAKDDSAKRKAGLKLTKDIGTATVTWAGTLLYGGDLRKANGTLLPDFKKSFIESISQEGDDLVNVSGGEIIKRSFKKDIGAYKFTSVKKAGEAAIENADDVAEASIKAKDAARLNNVKAGVKWAGAVVDAAFNWSDNIKEQKLASQSGMEMSTGRVAAETLIETAADIGLGIASNAAAGFVIGGAAALLGLSAPAIAVTAASAVAVWGVNEAFKYFTGKDAGENLADFLCDYAGLK